MKRQLPLLLSVFGCALSLAAGDAAAQAKYNLRWGHYLADGPFVQLEKDFAAAIEKRTNGQVKITITFSEGLGKTTELLMLTAKGAIDMTSTAPGYNPDQLHYWRAFQTPLTFTSSKQAMSVLQTVVKEFPVYKQEMDRAGVVWLFPQPLGEYYLSGPSPECDSVAKLKGKKIRSFGADIPKGFAADQDAMGALRAKAICSLKEEVRGLCRDHRFKELSLAVAAAKIAVGPRDTDGSKLLLLTGKGVVMVRDGPGDRECKLVSKTSLSNPESLGLEFGQGCLD